jgi:hypothetical protein
MVGDPFTINKAKVRELDFALIKRHLKHAKANLRYFGLPARDLLELRAWENYFCHFSAVERGKGGKGFLEQHNLMLTAMQYGLSDRLILLRGEMDEILLRGKDEFGTLVQYPFDVVSLDYSGGLLYKDHHGKSKRIQSIAQLFIQQADLDKDFLLFTSSNLDNEDQGEVRSVLRDINRELAKMGIDANKIIQKILNHDAEEARLKVYTPYLIKSLADKWYKCEYNKPVFYEGNRQTRMTHFSFWLKRTSKYSAGKPTPSDLINILNLPAFSCKDGVLTDEDFGITRLTQIPWTMPNGEESR